MHQKQMAGKLCPRGKPRTKSPPSRKGKSANGERCDAVGVKREWSRALLENLRLYWVDSEVVTMPTFSNRDSISTWPPPMP